MYHGQKRPATRGKSASTSIVVTAKTPPGRSAECTARSVLGRVGQVLDDVPHRDDVVGALGQRRVLDDADVHRSAHALLGALGRPARRLDARDVEARLLGQRDERADVAADVEQAAARRVARTCVEALGEGRDAPLLLLDVAHVLDVAVGVLHREVVRPRVHVDDAARAALDDAAEAAELAGGRRVVALRVDRLDQRRVVAHAVVVGIAQRAAHRDLAAWLPARPRACRAPATASGVRCDMDAHSRSERMSGSTSRRSTERRTRGAVRAASPLQSARARRGSLPRTPRVVGAGRGGARLVHPPHPVPDHPAVGRRGRLRVRRAVVGARRRPLRRRLGRPPAGAAAALPRRARAAGRARVRHPPHGGALVVRHRRRARAADHARWRAAAPAPRPRCSAACSRRRR